MKTVFDPDKIERDLRLLEREKSFTETRTSLFNLVIFSGTKDDAAEDLLAYLLGKRAARVIHIEMDNPGPTQVSVSARCAPDREDKGVCFQEILIRDGEDRAGTAPGSWSAFLIRDIPVNILWRASLKRKDTLAFAREQADKFVLDGDFLLSREGSDFNEYLMAVKTEILGEGVPAADFAWRRFQPLRFFTALTFEAEEAKRLLPGLTGLEISGGGPAARRLYALWAASALGMKRNGGDFTAGALPFKTVYEEKAGTELLARFRFGERVLVLAVDENSLGTARLDGKEIFSKVLVFPSEGDLLLQELDMPGIDGLYSRVLEEF